MGGREGGFVFARIGDWTEAPTSATIPDYQERERDNWGTQIGRAHV